MAGTGLAIVLFVAISSRVPLLRHSDIFMETLHTGRLLIFS